MANTLIGDGKWIPKVPPSRSEQRLKVILDSARDVFLENGYAGFSIDDVALRGKTSKATIYKYFKGKSELFLAVMDSAMQKTPEQHPHLDIEDFKEALTLFARQRIKAITSDSFIALQRIIIAEGPRYPEIAQGHYQSGAQYGIDVLAKFFKVHAKKGTIKAKNYDTAAQQFLGSLLYIPVLRRLLCVNEEFSNREVNKLANDAVDAFMKLYAT